MRYDIDKLRKIVITGEYLEDNFSDDKVRSQWIYEVEEFLDSIGEKKKLQSELQSMQFHGKKDIALSKFNSVMGFLRNKYNKGTADNIPSANIPSQEVFIVHGHDDELIEKVKKCVGELNLIPIVLRETANKGRTIIEKLESYLKNCKCAIVLYTPCDEGRSVKDTSLYPRARQNVVFEHGLFQGALSRKRVILLRKGETKLPGDNDGLVYTSVDGENWEDKLKREIEAIDH